jgi:predicted nucleic acid-binding protein
MSGEQLSPVVVDASIVVKWFLPEPDSALALAHQLHAAFYTADQHPAQRLGQAVAVNTLASSLPQA